MGPLLALKWFLKRLRLENPNLDPEEVTRERLAPCQGVDPSLQQLCPLTVVANELLVKADAECDSSVIPIRILSEVNSSLLQCHTARDLAALAVTYFRRRCTSYLFIVS